MTTKAQYELSFDSGLVEQYPKYREVLQAAVSGCGRPQKNVAADMDMTNSELSRKLADNPNDTVHFPAYMLPDLIRATGDLRPIYWLIEAFMDDPDAKRRRAASELADLLPKLQRLVAQANN
jgi:hypothetical protein